DPDALWPKIHGSGGARPHQLPERDSKVTIGQRFVIEDRARVVRHRPGRSGGRVTHHDEQIGLASWTHELGCSEQCGRTAGVVFAEVLAKHVDDWIRPVL